MDVYAKNGVVLDGEGDQPREYNPEEARAHAMRLLNAADQAFHQQRQIWALCEREGHDWGPWFNGHNPFRNHYRHCRRTGCLDPHEQHPGWMPFAARPHADMFGPRECSGPGCHHCETEQFGVVVRGFLREAAAGMAKFLDDTSEALR